MSIYIDYRLEEIAFSFHFILILCCKFLDTFFIRNRFIWNVAQGSLKLKKLFELHVLFIRNLVLDSLKFKKLLEIQGKTEKLFTNSALKSLPASTYSCTKTI